MYPNVPYPSVLFVPRVSGLVTVWTKCQKKKIEEGQQYVKRFVYRELN